MAKHRYTKSQIWEVSIVVTIILVVFYRLALVYDFVPDPYQPSSILSSIYTEIKSGLIAEADSQSMLGQAAKSTLDELKVVETYIKNQDEHYARAEAVAKKCQENMLFRYFMFMGDEDNPDCSPQNMQLQQAVKEINKPAGSPAADSTTGTPASAAKQPANPAPNNTPVQQPSAAN